MPSRSITIETTPKDLLRRLSNAGAVINQALAKTLDREVQKTLSHIIERRLSGRGPFPPSEHRLGQVTGLLKRSMYATKASVSGGVVSAAIGSPVKYAAIHEFGGQTRAHVIQARFAKSLRFQMAGKTVFARSVKHPGSTIPDRSPVAFGILDRIDQIGAALTTAAVNALEGKA